jgi:hypothetical protein
VCHVSQWRVPSANTQVTVTSSGSTLLINSPDIVLPWSLSTAIVVIDTSRWLLTHLSSSYPSCADANSCVALFPRYAMAISHGWLHGLQSFNAAAFAFQLLISVAIHAPNTLIPRNSDTCYIVLSYGYLPFALGTLLGSTNEVFSDRAARGTNTAGALHCCTVPVPSARIFRHLSCIARTSGASEPSLTAAGRDWSSSQLYGLALLPDSGI